MASEMWSLMMFSEPAKSAIVRATFRILSYALALKFRSVIADLKHSIVGASSAQ